MESIELQGETLGERHRHYNMLLKQYIENNITITNINAKDSDVINLMKIDIASYNKNVDFILDVLKSDDMLYVSRVIKKSTWLITDNKYAHIFNPQFLNSELFPHMTAKAIKKLILTIRLNLKDEPRVEEFYKYYEQRDPIKAFKWLQFCSICFIQEIIKKHTLPITAKTRLVKRLLERSIKIFETLKEVKALNERCIKQSKIFMGTDLNTYLSMAETLGIHWFPNMGRKHTKLITKYAPERVYNNFNLYCSHIDLSTFVKYLKKENIKHILAEQVNKENGQSVLKFNILKHFITQMPETEKNELLRRILLETDNESYSQHNQNVLEKKLVGPLRMLVLEDVYYYVWYEMVPFENAFKQLIPIYDMQPYSEVQGSILLTLITCAGNNQQHIQTILQYYVENHINVPFKCKSKFVEHLINKTDTHRYEEENWKMLDKIYHKMGVYKNSKNNIQDCIIISIIVYNVLHKEEIPEIIENKFEFNTLKTVRNNLNEEEKALLFNYLYSHLENEILHTEDQIKVMNDILSLLIVWEKELFDYPFVLNTMKRLVMFEKESNSKARLTNLFKNKRSWKWKHLLEESLFLYPSDDMCVYILKHRPQLIICNKSKIDSLCCNDKIVLKKFFHKLRIYWSTTLAKERIDFYRDRLTQKGGYKATARGLCLLLPKEELLELLKLYTPMETKIIWTKDKSVEIGIRKNLARNMHMARPQPNPSVLLSYARGDYLHKVHPSILAIFYNLPSKHIRDYFSIFLKSTNTLLKHGIRLACMKLKLNEIRVLFLNVWKSDRNIKIKQLMLNMIIELHCRIQSDLTDSESIWELLELFFDSFEDNKDKLSHYKMLPDIKDIPFNIRGKFLIKYFNSVKSCLPNSEKQYKIKLRQLFWHTKLIMDHIDQDFVLELILNFIKYNYGKHKNSVVDRYESIEVICFYILCANSEEVQMDKYNKLIVPIFDLTLSLWDKKDKNNENFIRYNFTNFLYTLSMSINSFVLKKDVIIPVKLFNKILNLLESKFPLPVNFVLIRQWKLATTFVEILNKFVDNFDRRQDKCLDWQNICEKIAPEFGKACLTYMREDMNAFYNSVHLIYADLFDRFLHVVIYIPPEAVLEICHAILREDCSEEACLLVVKVLPDYVTKEGLEAKVKEMRDTYFLNNPSLVAKIGYNLRILDRRGFINDHMWQCL